MLVRDALDRLMVEEKRGILCLLHVQLQERLWAEGGVSRHSDVAARAQVKQILLDEVRVVFDLKGLWHDLGVALDVENQGAVVVGDTDGLDEAFIVQLLHGVVGFLQWCLAERQLVVLVEEAWRVADGWVDVLERDGEVDDVEVEVVDLPVLKLLLANGLHALLVMERIPVKKSGLA